MKKLAILAIAGILSFIGMGTAEAQFPRVDVGNGTGVRVGPGLLGGGSRCTIGAVGRDDLGRLVAITAGHCNTRPGEHQPLFVWGVQIGTFETINTQPWNAHQQPVNSSTDYAVALLDESRVNAFSTFSFNQVTHPNPGTPMTKYGQVTGHTSCVVNAFANNTIYAPCTALPGDSGGPVTIEGGFAGINSAINVFGDNQFTHISGILADIAAQGPTTVGIGFDPVP